MYIKTNKAIIRNINILDSEAYLKNIGSNINVGKFMLYPIISTIDEARDVINYFIREDIFGSIHNYCIEINNELVGTVCIIENKQHDNCELSYNLAEKYWCKGIMTEVLREIIKEAFKKYDTIIVEAIDKNIACNKLLKKLNFHFDGCTRNKYKDRFGKKQNINIYSLLKEEFRE